MGDLEQLRQELWPSLKFAGAVRGKSNLLKSLEAKFAYRKCPCHRLRRCSQIIQFVIRFAPQPQRTVCPVTKKAIFENLESDQSVARLVNPNFGLVR